MAGGETIAPGKARTSVVIPTVNRAEALARCLRSIEGLRPGFDEIVIVVAGDAGPTRRAAEGFAQLPLSVVEHPVRSAAAQRNAGIERATGDFVFFVDDDTELSPDYVAAALAGFEAHPEAVGLTGPVRIPPGRPGAPARWRSLWPEPALWLLGVRSVFRSRVLRSGFEGMPMRPLRRRPHPVEHLHGENAVYRRRVFDDGFRFEKRFIRWSFGEDTMLSYRVHKHYGRGSLWWAPALTLTHHHDDRRSIGGDAALRMQIVYRFIFWRREVYGGSWFNLFRYLCGQAGWLLKMLVRSPPRRRRPILVEARASWSFLLAHWRDVADHRIDYNHFVLHGTTPPAAPREGHEAE